jgi:hypothetical protein
MKSFYISCVVMFFLIFCDPIVGQNPHYLQLDFNGGISLPMQDFKSSYMFAGRGLSFGGGFDYFFGKLGVGISAGYFANPTSDLFKSYIAKKFLETPDFIQTNDWNTKYALLGPTYKLAWKKFEIDLFAKGGISQIQVPDLLYAKTFFNQSYDLYYFTGASEDYQFAWAAGVRLIYKPLYWLGIQLKSDYFTTSYISKVNYDYTYRDATDGNRNGVIEDTEYFESQKVTKGGTANISVLNLHLGLILQLGKHKPTLPVTMVPKDIMEPDPLIENVEETSPQKPNMEYKLEELPIVNLEEKVLVEEDKIEKINVPIIEEKVVIEAPKTPEVVVKEEVATNIALPVVVEKPIIEDKKIEPEVVKAIELPETDYDAPEAKYDEEAAEFLYKAGESYFASNDFENAVPCFNKLKADPKYPRAKYMFALSLCSMGNCQEAKKEYKSFAKTYKESDARTLEIIFASHFERCATKGKLIKNIKSNLLL